MSRASRVQEHTRDCCRLGNAAETLNNDASAVLYNDYFACWLVIKKCDVLSVRSRSFQLAVFVGASVGKTQQDFRMLQLPATNRVRPPCQILFSCADSVRSGLSCRAILAIPGATWNSKHPPSVLLPRDETYRRGGSHCRHGRVDAVSS